MCVAYCNGKPILRDAVEEYERARDYLWDELIPNPDLRSEYLKTYIPRHEFNIFMDNVKAYLDDPDHWVKNYRPHFEGDRRIDAPTYFPLSPDPYRYSDSSDSSDDFDTEDWDDSSSSDSEMEMVNAEGIELDEQGKLTEPSLKLWADRVAERYISGYGRSPVLPPTVTPPESKDVDDVSIKSPTTFSTYPNEGGSSISSHSPANDTSNAVIIGNNSCNTGEPPGYASPPNTDVTPLRNRTNAPWPGTPIILINGHPIPARSRVQSFQFAVPYGCSTLPNVNHKHSVYGVRLPPDRYDSTHPIFKHPATTLFWRNFVFDRDSNVHPAGSYSLSPNSSSPGRVIQVFSALPRDGAVPNDVAATSDTISIDHSDHVRGSSPISANVVSDSTAEPLPIAHSFQHRVVIQPISNGVPRSTSSNTNLSAMNRPPTPHPFALPRLLAPLRSITQPSNNDIEELGRQPSTPRSVIASGTPSPIPSLYEEDQPDGLLFHGTPSDRNTNDPVTTASSPPPPSEPFAASIPRSPPAVSGTSSTRSSVSTLDLSDSRTFFFHIVVLILSWLTSIVILTSSTLIALR
jgi:hypothetical protein